MNPAMYFEQDAKFKDENPSNQLQSTGQLGIQSEVSNSILSDGILQFLFSALTDNSLTGKK